MDISSINIRQSKLLVLIVDILKILLDVYK